MAQKWQTRHAAWWKTSRGEAGTKRMSKIRKAAKTVEKARSIQIVISRRSSWIPACSAALSAIRSAAPNPDAASRSAKSTLRPQAATPAPAIPAIRSAAACRRSATATRPSAMAACPRSKKTRPCPPIRSLLAEAAAAIRSPAARPSMAMPDAMRSSRSAAAWAAFLAARSCSTRRVCSHSTMDPWLNQAMRKKAGSRKSWFRVPKAHRQRGEPSTSSSPKTSRSTR
mmetsp:Transcript_7477/g.24548  ORF Transcript_7477/g.24548 Transcript_7477/m.24548 type:complete len:227 (-) Transcript_7477:64-744(-)